MPLVTSKARTTAYRLLLRELPGPLRALPKRALADLLRTWHDGIVRQVTSFLTDMRIEGWLFDQCPGMRGAQVTALAEQLRENEMVLRPKVQALTARTVYRANVAINCAFAQFVALLLGESSLPEPYPDQLCKRGRELLREVNIQTDPGHPGDVGIAERWSQILGLAGWFKWTGLGDAPGIDVYLT